jgi:hypothetical protein
MSDQHVTVAFFPTPTEAEMARNLLEDEGISVLLLGDISANALTGMVGPAGSVELQVPDTEVQRARDVLAASFAAAREANAAIGAPLTAAGKPGWACPNCDDVVDLDIEVCPSCGTLMEDPSAPTSAMSLLQDEGPAPEQLATWVGDRLAQRALRAALIALVLPIVGVPFSWYPLGKLLTFKGELSPTGTRQLYFALVINLFSLPYNLILFLFLLSRLL